MSVFIYLIVRNFALLSPQLLFFFTKHIVMKTKNICIDSLSPKLLEVAIGDRVKMKSQVILKVVDFDAYGSEHDVITCKVEASDATVTIQPADIVEIIKEVVAVIEESKTFWQKIAAFWQKIKNKFSKK